MASNTQPYWSAKHVRTLAELPAKLTLGRAYFVDDEQIIIIDHGSGPVYYGAKPGPQGQPGEPIPILQNQIDSLTDASFKQTFLLDESLERLRAKMAANFQANNTRADNLQNFIANVDKQRSEDLLMICDQLEHAAQGIITLTEITSTLCDNLRGTEGALLKLLLESENQSTTTPLSQFQLTTDDGLAYTVTTADDGTLIFTQN